MYNRGEKGRGERMLDEIKENCPFKNDISVCEFCARLSVCYAHKEIIEMDLQKRLAEVTDGKEDNND